MHKLVEPAILYFGTPVVLVSSTNEDGSPNLAADVLGLVACMELHAGPRRPLQDAGQHPAHGRMRAEPSVRPPSRRRGQARAGHGIEPGAPAQGGHGLPA